MGSPDRRSPSTRCSLRTLWTTLSGISVGAFANGTWSSMMPLRAEEREPALRATGQSESLAQPRPTYLASGDWMWAPHHPAPEPGWPFDPHRRCRHHDVGEELLGLMAHLWVSRKARAAGVAPGATSWWKARWRRLAVAFMALTIAVGG